MDTQRPRQVMIWATTLAIGLGTVAPAQDYKWEKKPGTFVALKRGEIVVWQFCYGPDEPKPYFHPVALPDGRVLTWNQPPDHRWHHALWFAWKYLNGVNYWEPDPLTGRPAGATQWDDVRVTTCPDNSARIAMALTYRPHNAAPVLTEQRTIDISAPAADGQYHFDWTTTFTAAKVAVTFDRTPLEGEPGGKAWGGYAGLSVRFAKDLTERRADTTEGPVVFNQQSRHRSKAPAMDYHGLIGDQPVGIAICDHPKNLNHPTPWYAIRSKPMSYFSPAVICYGPYTLPAGQSMTLRYRVIVHSGRWDSVRLRREFLQWHKRAQPTAASTASNGTNGARIRTLLQ